MFFKLCACGLVAFGLGQAARTIDEIGGKGTTNAGVSTGADQTASLMGEIARIPSKVITEVRPGFQGLATEAGNTLGSAGTGTTLPATNDVAPNEDGSGQ